MAALSECFSFVFVMSLFSKKEKFYQEKPLQLQKKSILPDQTAFSDNQGKH